jgi:hypothetical protein
MISIALAQTPFKLSSSFPGRIFTEVSAYTLHQVLPTFQVDFLGLLVPISSVQSIRSLCSRLHPILSSFYFS